MTTNKTVKNNTKNSKKRDTNYPQSKEYKENNIIQHALVLLLNPGMYNEKISQAVLQELSEMPQSELVSSTFKARNIHLARLPIQSQWIDESANEHFKEYINKHFPELANSTAYKINLITLAKILSSSPNKSISLVASNILKKYPSLTPQVFVENSKLKAQYTLALEKFEAGDFSEIHTQLDPVLFFLITVSESDQKMSKKQEDSIVSIIVDESSAKKVLTSLDVVTKNLPPLAFANMHPKLLSTMSSFDCTIEALLEDVQKYIGVRVSDKSITSTMSKADMSFYANPHWLCSVSAQICKTNKKTNDLIDKYIAVLQKLQKHNTYNNYTYIDSKWFSFSLNQSNIKHILSTYSAKFSPTSDTKVLLSSLKVKNNLNIMEPSVGADVKAFFQFLSKFAAKKDIAQNYLGLFKSALTTHTPSELMATDIYDSFLNHFTTLKQEEVNSFTTSLHALNLHIPPQLCLPNNVKAVKGKIRLADKIFSANEKLSLNQIIATSNNVNTKVLKI